MISVQIRKWVSLCAKWHGRYRGYWIILPFKYYIKRGLLSRPQGSMILQTQIHVTSFAFLLWYFNLKHAHLSSSLFLPTISTMHFYKAISFTFLTIAAFIPSIFADEPKCVNVWETPDSVGCALWPHQTFCYKVPTKYYRCCLNRQACVEDQWIWRLEIGGFGPSSVVKILSVTRGWLNFNMRFSLYHRCHDTQAEQVVCQRIIIKYNFSGKTIHTFSLGSP